MNVFELVDELQEDEQLSLTYKKTLKRINISLSKESNGKNVTKFLSISKLGDIGGVEYNEKNVTNSIKDLLKNVRLAHKEL